MGPGGKEEEMDNGMGERKEKWGKIGY